MIKNSKGLIRGCVSNQQLTYNGISLVHKSQKNHLFEIEIVKKLIYLLFYVHRLKISYTIHDKRYTIVHNKDYEL